MTERKSVDNSSIYITVKNTISRYRMFQKGDAVLVGVSGGPDSVVLLHVLMTLAPELSIHLAVAHLNHGLRGEESDRDADFSAALADSHSLPFHYSKANVDSHRKKYKLSMEEAGRRLRYRFFEEVTQENGYQRIALGHHAGDCAEDVLMYLLRGSGPLGISGIPPVRNNKIVRPLIELTQPDIMAFLVAQGIEYVSDSTNRDMRYLRNKIRHQLIPHLKSAYNPKIIETLNRLSNILRDEEAWMTETILSRYDDALIPSDGDRVRLSISKLTVMPTAVKRRIIRCAIEKAKGDLRKISYTHIEKIMALCQRGPLSGRLDLPDRIRIERDHTVLAFSKHAKPLRQSGLQKTWSASSVFKYRVHRPDKRRDEIVWIDELGGHLKLSEISNKKLPDDCDAGQKVAFFDMDTIRFPLIVRNVQPGDRFSPLGMKGSQKIKDFFINNKVPRAERIICPVMVSDGKIIWVMGYRIDDSVKVRAHTQKLLKAEVLLA